MSIAPTTQPMHSPIISLLSNLLVERADEIDAWFEKKRAGIAVPFYSSVDLRHAGYKIAPVDTNLFSAGFNNLSASARQRASARMQQFLREHHVNKVLIIPENHTRNLFYLDNLSVLQSILMVAGAEVEIGTLASEETLHLTAANGCGITQHPLKKEGSILRTKNGFTPQLIVLNNDLTSGFPELLRGVSQLITPRPRQGWFRRRKSIYFEAYDRLAKDFARSFDLDPWLLSTEFHKCGQVNFSEAKGQQCVALGVERVLQRIREHYARYDIHETPYVFIKSDSGTYGMGIMTARSGEEVIEMNKKARNKMKTIKEGAKSTEVIIQEGVPTACRIDDAPAEPMMYAIGSHAIGGAYRVNKERDAEGNLNSQGMVFTPMRDLAEGDAEGEGVCMSRAAYQAFDLVTALASLAAPLEEYGESYSI
jgi:glutamate--cysteine ligase